MPYIDRGKAFDVLTEYYHHKTPIQKESLKEALSRVPTADVVDKERYDRLLENATIIADALNKYQDADVVEVKHGRWKGEELGDYRCSLCGPITTHTRTNFCPNCGENMDGRKAEYGDGEIHCGEDDDVER